MREPLWIDERDVLALHGRLLALHGGAAGLRDQGLLQSALARPRQQYAYAAPDIIDMAAAYTVGIVRNHPLLTVISAPASLPEYSFWSTLS